MNPQARGPRPRRYANLRTRSVHSGCAAAVLVNTMIVSYRESSISWSLTHYWAVIMFAFTESDYLPIQTFRLHWRFTDPKYVQLTPAELARVHPLSPTASSAAHRAILTLIGERESPSPAVAIVSGMQFDASGDPHDARVWLERVLHGRHCQVVVSWDADTAVVTTLPLFIKYWDDFCYPSSDDTTIIPFDLSWIVQYRHWEVLSFATRVRDANAGG